MKKKIALLLPLAFGCLSAYAQAVPSSCPGLPADAGLQWETQVGEGFNVCRAMNANGQQILGMMFTHKKPGVPLLRNQRQGEGSIGRYDVYWYRPTIADPDVVEKRVTVLELEDERYVQVWVEANSTEELQRSLALMRGINL